MDCGDDILCSFDEEFVKENAVDDDEDAECGKNEKNSL